MSPQGGAVGIGIVWVIVGTQEGHQIELTQLAFSQCDQTSYTLSIGHESAPAKHAGHVSRPDSDQLLQLHERLVEGNPTASAEIAEILYEWLLHRLQAAVAYASTEDVADVAADALVRYLANPDRFRPERGKGLAGFLLMDARGDLLNLLRSKRKLQPPTPISDAVADQLEDRNIRSMTQERMLERLPSRLDERVLELLPDRLDRGILELMMDGVRDSDAYASLMGLSERSREVQAREVKRAKDRIRARLKRGGISRDW